MLLPPQPPLSFSLPPSLMTDNVCFETLFIHFPPNFLIQKWSITSNSLFTKQKRWTTLVPSLCHAFFTFHIRLFYLPFLFFGQRSVCLSPEVENCSVKLDQCGTASFKIRKDFIFTEESSWEEIMISSFWARPEDLRRSCSRRVFLNPESGASAFWRASGKHKPHQWKVYRCG